MARTFLSLSLTKTYEAPFVLTHVTAQLLWPAFAPLAPHILSLIQPVHDVELSAAYRTVLARTATITNRQAILIAFFISAYLRWNLRRDSLSRLSPSGSA